MRRLRRDESGVAALELALFSTVFLLLAFGALPVYAMARAYQRVVRSSSSTLRYATSVSSNGTRNGAGVLSRRPSYDDIATFARDDANDPHLAVVVTVCKGATCTPIDAATPGHDAPIPAAAGDTVRVTLSATVDMTAIGTVANAVTRLSGGDAVFPDNATTVTSTADAREE